MDKKRHLLSFMAIIAILMQWSFVAKAGATSDSDSLGRIQDLVAESLEKLYLPDGTVDGSRESIAIDEEALVSELDLSSECTLNSYEMLCEPVFNDYAQRAKIELDGSRILYLDSIYGYPLEEGTEANEDVVEENIEATEGICGLLGVRDDERSIISREVWRDTTTDSADSAGDGAIQRSRVNYIIYVQREVNGIQVVNNRLIFVYENDGKLRSINGKWHQTNYAGSHFATDKTADEIADMASNAVMEMGIDVDAIGKIEMKAIFLVDENEFSESVFDLKLMLTAYINDIDKNGAPISPVTVEMEL